MRSLLQLSLENSPHRYDCHKIYYKFNNRYVTRVELDKFPVRPINKYCNLIAYDIDIENKKVNSLLFFDSMNKVLFNSTKEVCEKLYEYVRMIDKLVSRLGNFIIDLDIGRAYYYSPYIISFIRYDGVVRTESLIADILYNNINLKCNKCGKFNINIKDEKDEIPCYEYILRIILCIDCYMSYSEEELLRCRIYDK